MLNCLPASAASEVPHPFAPHWIWLTPFPRFLSFSIDVGPSLVFHGSGDTHQTVSTFVTAQGSLTFWIARFIGFYGVASISPIGENAGSQFYGGGIKLPVFTLLALSPTNYSFHIVPNSFLNGISFQLVAEGVKFRMNNLSPTVSGEPTGISARGGLALNWYFRSPRVYLNTTALATVFYNNFFIIAYTGLGFNF